MPESRHNRYWIGLADMCTYVRHHILDCDCNVYRKPMNRSETCVADPIWVAGWRSARQSVIQSYYGQVG